MRFLTLVVVLAAFAGGFAIGIVGPAIKLKSANVARVNLQHRFDSRLGRSLLDNGWGKTGGGGTPLTGSKGSVLVGFDGPARGDVDLQIEGKVEHGSAEALIIRFNDAELGRWRLTGDASYARRRFVIPKDVVNEDTVGRLSFEYVSTGSKVPPFTLVSVSLRDLRPQLGRKGFVDSCRPNEIVGWAVVNNIGSTVVAKVNGQPIAHAFTTKERGDLAEYGLPQDAGFILTPKQTIPAGSTVEVEFYDGRPLGNSPCKI